MMALEDRTAVINGASGELGTLLARSLAANGANLALLERDPARLESVVEKLALPAQRVMALTVDLMNLSDVQAAAAQIQARFGHIDILLHVIGGWVGGKTLLETARDDLQFMVNQHIWTSFHAVQAFVPYMLQNGWGRVVMVTSPFAARPRARGGAYAVGKAGQETLLLTLAQEVAGSGVTANMLQAKTIDVKREKVSKPAPENTGWTTPEELVAATMFLLSNEAGTINGARIPLFGGSS